MKTRLGLSRLISWMGVNNLRHIFEETKFQPQNPGQNSSSKSWSSKTWPNFSPKVLTKSLLQHLNQTPAVVSSPKLRFKILTKLQLQNLEQTFVNMVLSININNTTVSRCWNLQRTESHQSSLLNSSLLVCYKGRKSNSGSMKNHLMSQVINVDRTSTLATFVWVIIGPKSDHGIALSVTESVTESVQRCCQTGRSSLLYAVDMLLLLLCWCHAVASCKITAS